MEGLTPLLSLVITRLWRLVIARVALVLATEFRGFAGEEKPNNEAEQTQDGAENLNDEDSHEPKRSGLVCGCTRLPKT
jgi:hypothetical protein